MCHASRWKGKENEHLEDINNFSSKDAHLFPAKVVWHFPLKPRLERLYMYSKTTELIRWHDEKRVKDDLLRHPTDGEAWKYFDEQHSNFSSEARNFRLGLASDGYNPFRTLSTQHST